MILPLGSYVNKSISISSKYKFILIELKTSSGTGKFAYDTRLIPTFIDGEYRIRVCGIDNYFSGDISFSIKKDSRILLITTGCAVYGIY